MCKNNKEGLNCNPKRSADNNNNNICRVNLQMLSVTHLQTTLMQGKVASPFAEVIRPFFFTTYSKIKISMPNFEREKNGLCYTL